MKSYSLLRIIAIAVLLLSTASTPRVYAFLGFGDEEQLPGKWESPAAVLVFTKDGNGTITNGLNMSVNFNWAIKGGKLKLWGKDNTISSFILMKILGLPQNSECAVKFNGNDEFTLDGQLTFHRQKQ